MANGLVISGSVVTYWILYNKYSKLYKDAKVKHIDFLLRLINNEEVDSQVM